MAYKAIIIPVMIASPGDVLKERDIVRKVIHEWNDVNAATCKIVLIPVGWDTHSSPELGTKPQDLINIRVLKDCDLLIGIFWTRLGTPTDEAESGTIEEIEKHISAGKPAMIYFSSQPVVLNTVDTSQYNKVKKFQKKCEGGSLIGKFDSPDQLKDILSKDIQICLNTNPYLQNIINQKNNIIIERETNSKPDTIIFSISEDSKTLLKVASEKKDDGMILKRDSIGGINIQAGTLSHKGLKGKEAAKWENVLKELVEERLVIPNGYKGEVFKLTLMGWQVAELL